MAEKPAVWAGGFDIAAKEKEAQALEAEMSSPDFWKNRQLADEKIKTLGELNSLVGKFKEVERGLVELSKNFDEGKFFEVKKKFRE